MTEFTKTSRGKMIVGFLFPIVLLFVLLWVFLKFGPLGVFEADLPPIEEIFVKDTILTPENITLEIFNDGPETVTLAQLTVNEAIWQFEMTPEDNTLEPLESGEISIFYPWIEGDPIGITLFASDGVTFEHEIGVAFETPTFNFIYFKTFVLLGIYVGVIPILIGLLWFPFLRKLRGDSYNFLLSLTIGLLVFLGVDTLAESFEFVDQVASTFNGLGVLLIGFLLAIFVLAGVSYKTERHVAERGDQFKALVWGYLIALGIGLHNLGEGLAIGSAYAIGEIALGGSLVIGFMVHNVTEGVAIVSPLTKNASRVGKIFWHLFWMGIIAGAPTILGTLIGGFAYAPIYSLLFLAIGAGAIFEVSFDILHHMAKGRFKSLFTQTNILGFMAGLLIMYFTGFLVLG